MTPLRRPCQMFSCNACLWRTFRALTALDVEVSQIQSGNTFTFRRNHATFASIQKGHHRSLLIKALRSKRPAPLSRAERLRGPSVVSRRNERAIELNSHQLDIEENGQDPKGFPHWAATVDKSLRTELAWTGGDALKLARAVLDKLKASSPLRALEMVRASEKMPGINGMKAVDNVVSWNHVMDYYMSKGQTREAFKVFNEMKKRGHKPDAHTFTIMLRGYTMNHENYKAVEEAMGVYNSIWRPESNVRPSTVHSNAIINCLGRSLNMDGLWSVAGRLPERGPGSADKWTYTTILNTMQACALRDARQLSDTDGDLAAAAKMMQTAIGEGRKMWEHIVSRWRSGEINIDQTLVCAMGRLLLLGEARDWDDVFSLVEQTMRLPRVKPPRRARKADSDEELGHPSDAHSLEHEGDSADLRQLEAAVGEEASATVTNEFAVVDLSQRPSRVVRTGQAESAYANVGNNVLSLLIEASVKLKDASAGKSYWAQLTDQENDVFVVPDDENLRSYLRLLRISRASKMVSELLRNPPNGVSERTWYKRATFVLAMSTCARDFKNPNVFTYASTILDVMEAKLPEPDLKVMTMYLSLALVVTPGISTEMAGKFRAEAGENKAIRAIRRFHYSSLDYRKIMAKMWKEPVPEPQERDQKLASDRNIGRGPSSTHPDDLVEFLQILNSAYDKLLKHRLLMTDQLAEELTRNKRDLSRALQMARVELLPVPQKGKKPYQGPHSFLPSRKPSSHSADLLTEHDPELRANRYPNQMSRNVAATGRGAKWTAGGKIKGPRIVDVDKRHPFLKRKNGEGLKQKYSREGEAEAEAVEQQQQQQQQRQQQRSEATDPFSEGGGWGAGWKASQRNMTRGQKGSQKEWVV